MKTFIFGVAIASLCLFNFQLLAQENATDSGKEAEESDPINHVNSPSFGTRNDEQWKQMQATPVDQDGEFLMVNLMKFREKAKYADGRQSDLTGEQANARYSPIEFLGQIGAGIEFIGSVVEQLGDSKPGWDEVGIVRYPSREKFIGMVTNPEFEKKSIHKDAGLALSQVLVTQRMTWEVTNAKKINDEPDAFNLAQLFKFHDNAKYSELDAQNQKRTGQEAMDAFDAMTADVLSKVGARPLLKTKVEGTLIGDGRSWSEFRLLHFPSEAAFVDYLSTVKKMEDAIEHRNAAIDDAYEMKVETMSFAKRLALDLAISAMGQKKRQRVTKTPENQKKTP